MRRDPNFRPAPAAGYTEEETSTEETYPFGSTSGDTGGNAITDALSGFFTSGNIVVKVAMVILFFGLSFLIKYAADNNLLPIEFRLLGVAAFGFLLLFIGWRLRASNTLYALVLQGGAVGILYLTLYSAGRLDVIPMSMAFVLLFLVVIASCVLAVIQDAKALALFATAGGFMAPILTSTGEGSHVSLFSYYVVLNIGIFIIAWFKSWRSLNWLGFMFTFIIASLWAMKFYQPEFFTTTQPFLIIFFLFYVAISVLFAFKQPPNLKGLVDGTLVFGAPLVGFALQSQLVDDFEYGHALSAVVLGVFYFVLQWFLDPKKYPGMQALKEAFLALAVIFFTLSIPFIVDGHWTAAAWALEGAGILWIALRQDQYLARIFGLLLQLGAAIIFLARNEDLHAHLPLLNSLYIGSVMIALAGWFSAYQYFKYKPTRSVYEIQISHALFYWGSLWWFGSHFHEIEQHLTYGHQELNAMVLVLALSTLFIISVAQYLRWPFPERNAVAYLPVFAWFILAAFISQGHKHPFAHFGFIVWPLGFFVNYLLLYRNREKWSLRLLNIYHAISVFITIFFVTWIVVDSLIDVLPLLDNWQYLLWGLLPALLVFTLLSQRNETHWPLAYHRDSYLGTGLVAVFVVLGLWVYARCFQLGDPAPLPYLPVLNPQDLVQLLILGLLFFWIHLWREGAIPKPVLFNPEIAYGAFGLLLFIWINSVVAHAVHFYAGVNFDLSTMLQADEFQLAIAIVWTLTAFAVMLIATRGQYRKLWYAGVSLLILVVLKLFVIDLADSGTITRIVSFLSVGVLMLIIGYFSPIPPKRQAPNVNA